MPTGKPDEVLDALLRTPRPMVKKLDKDALAQTEDWVGNNAAFTCPKCGKVFLVSGMMHKDGRSGGVPGVVEG